MSDPDEKGYFAKAKELCDEGLEDAVDEAVMTDDGPRSLMITVRLSRSSSRSSIAHPIHSWSRTLHHTF